MKIELVPVIKTDVWETEVKRPSNSPYWEHPQEWDNFMRESLMRAGFSSSIRPYHAGHPFFGDCGAK